MGKRLLTIGIAATYVGRGCQAHHVRRLIERGLIPHERVGRLYVVTEDSLDTIREQADRAGYLRAEVLAHA